MKFKQSPLSERTWPVAGRGQPMCCNSGHLQRERESHCCILLANRLAWYIASRRVSCTVDLETVGQALLVRSAAWTSDREICILFASIKRNKYFIGIIIAAGRPQNGGVLMAGANLLRRCGALPYSGSMLILADLAPLGCWRLDMARLWH